jgi:hypothetical protein
MYFCPHPALRATLSRLERGPSPKLACGEITVPNAAADPLVPRLIPQPLPPFHIRVLGGVRDAHFLLNIDDVPAGQ